MFTRIVRLLSRSAVAALAMVAVSYHLTESAHRQADREKERQQSAQQSTGGPHDKQKGNSKQRPILSWLAPDMVNRNALRAVAHDEAVRRIVSGGTSLPIDGRPVVVSPCRTFIRMVTSQEMLQPALGIRVSDRPAHGPPATC